MTKQRITTCWTSGRVLPQQCRRSGLAAALRQRVHCCVARAQAGVLLSRLKFALPGWAQAERRRPDWREQAAQRAAQARAYSGEGHSEEWRFEFSRSYPH